MNDEANISYKWVYENFVIHALLTEGLAKGSGGSIDRSDKILFLKDFCKKLWRLSCYEDFFF
jgi:hypothetical protein